MMIQLLGPCAYSFGLAMVLPLFFPSLHLLFFAPFLVLCFYRCPLSSCLWWALSCGFVIDLLSAQTRLGTYAMNYCLTTLFLYRYKFHFFEDRLSTLPIMTLGFACLSTLIQIAIFYTIGKPLSLSWEWMTNNLFFSPLQDALYAILAFTIPSLVISHIKRRSFFSMARRRKS